MEHCQPNQSFRRPARRATSLLPLLQRALRDSEQRRKLRLRQSGLDARLRDGGTSLNGRTLAAASLEFARPVQYFLPDIALGL